MLAAKRTPRLYPISRTTHRSEAFRRPSVQHAVCCGADDVSKPLEGKFCIREMFQGAARSSLFGVPKPAGKRVDWQIRAVVRSWHPARACRTNGRDPSDSVCRQRNSVEARVDARTITHHLPHFSLCRWLRRYLASDASDSRAEPFAPSGQAMPAMQHQPGSGTAARATSV